MRNTFFRLFNCGRFPCGDLLSVGSALGLDLLLLEGELFQGQGAIQRERERERERGRERERERD